MVNETSKWILSKSKSGKNRTIYTMGLFAINNAFAEKLPFTALDCCMVKGRHFTYNFDESSA